MTKQNEVYKCEICGNIVTVLHASNPTPVCCNQPMTLQKENTVDASTEKHVPIITKNEKTITVTVGSEPHPMTEEHHIGWIEITSNNKIQRKFLKPGDEPKAEFYINQESETITARAYCNLHGLWKSE